MLATIIIDSFTLGEAAQIADALDMLCAPDDTYGFASVGIYSFWSIPERDILYVGLAGDLRQRFRQHTGLISCDPDCCKRREIEEYFRDRPRLGYSVMVQSPMDQPPSAGELESLAENYDDAFADATDLFGGGENAAVAGGWSSTCTRSSGAESRPGTSSTVFGVAGGGAHSRRSGIESARPRCLPGPARRRKIMELSRPTSYS